MFQLIQTYKHLSSRQILTVSVMTGKGNKGLYICGHLDTAIIVQAWTTDSVSVHVVSGK